MGTCRAPGTMRPRTRPHRGRRPARSAWVTHELRPAVHGLERPMACFGHGGAALRGGAMTSGCPSAHLHRLGGDTSDRSDRHGRGWTGTISVPLVVSSAFCPVPCLGGDHRPGLGPGADARRFACTPLWPVENRAPQVVRLASAWTEGGVASIVSGSDQGYREWRVVAQVDEGTAGSRGPTLLSSSSRSRRSIELQGSSDEGRT